MKKIVTSICSIAALSALVMIMLSIGRSSTHQDQAAPDPASDAPSPAHELRSMPLARLWVTLVHAVGFEDSLNPGEALNDELHAQQRITVSLPAVLDEAAQVVLPYRDEEQRQEVLRRLRDTEELFDDMIGTAEERIRDAAGRGERSDRELREADEALSEMRKGRQFVTSRIRMVEESKP